jgi:UDP-N-acetylglucosamine--N-acetylmuramyl-(pentapeptide) pyrophosphoryl-undecaprenol N-acetylglucosamine transferase
VKRVVLTGGGTGGHITPLLAVAHELKKQQPDCHIVYIGERNGKYAHLTDNHSDIDEVRTVFAGKFRRYHGESWLRRLADIRTNLLNIRDLFLFVIGTLQSLVLIRRLKPDIILLKGGFVGVPVGLAAAFWRRPFITHDSDALPGLANRITGRWARLHATGMPAEYYSYKRSQVRHIGVLVGADYRPVEDGDQAAFKKELGVPDNSPLLLVTGGSGGAGKINTAIRVILPELLERYPDLRVVHQVGVGKGSVYKDFSHERLQVYELLKPMHVYTGAADVVVTRAGANTMAELGVQGKACAVIPNPLLTGGHQLKNAQFLEENQAALVIDERQLGQDVNLLLQAVTSLLDNQELRKNLGINLKSLTIPDAASRLAEILLLEGGSGRVRP